MNLRETIGGIRLRAKWVSIKIESWIEHMEENTEDLERILDGVAKTLYKRSGIALGTGTWI